MNDDNGTQPALPPGWAWATLDEICAPVPRVNPARDLADRAQIRYVDVSAITDHKIIEPQALLPSSAPGRARQIIAEGDTLFSCARVYLQNIARVPRDLDGEVASTAFAVLRPADGVDPGYLHWLVRRQQFITEMMDKQRGNSPPAVLEADVKAANVPLAPEREQSRIASRMGELFSEIEAGEQELARAREALGIFRRALLKAAVTGALTKDWRESNAPAESGEEHLGRILTERRTAWNRAESAKIVIKGQGSKTNAWKQRYTEPTAPGLAAVPELPRGWIWATVDQLCWRMQYGSSAKCSVDSTGVPILRMGNIQDGAIDHSSLKYLPRDHREFPDLLLEPGDILFNRTNSAELLGKTAIYDGSVAPCSFASYLIRLKAVGVAPEYLGYYISSAYGRAWIAENKSQQVGQANLSGGKLKMLCIPVPPRAEQSEIVRRVEEMLNTARELESGTFWLETVRLRQAILRAAFAGKLAPQDSSDEPASALLARLRHLRTCAAGEAAAPTVPKPRRRASRRASG